jgi:DNA polymerase-3 subunit delta
MQVRIADLPAALERRLAPVYAVHGDEVLLAIEAGDLVRAAARRAGCEEREVLVAESGFAWDQLAAATRNLSLFGGRKLIDLRIPSGRPGTAGAAVLQRIAESPNPDHVLLVTLPRLDRATLGSAWFSALERAGVAVAAAALDRGELPRWIASRLARQNQRASREVLAFLAARTEGNLLAAHQEIVKLGLLLAPGEIGLADVERAVADVARFDVFDLSEAWLAGNATRVARILGSLQAEGDTLQLVLWQLGEDVHALNAIAEATAAGAPLAQAVRTVRAWGRRQAQLEAAARRITPARAGELLAALARLDALSKGIGRDRVWDRLAQTALALAGVSLGPPLAA